MEGLGGLHSKQRKWSEKGQETVLCINQIYTVKWKVAYFTVIIETIIEPEKLTYVRPGKYIPATKLRILSLKSEFREKKSEILLSFCI